jgi:hypothetical protein
MRGVSIEVGDQRLVLVPQSTIAELSTGGSNRTPISGSVLPGKSRSSGMTPVNSSISSASLEAEQFAAWYGCQPDRHLPIWR